MRTTRILAAALAAALFGPIGLKAQVYTVENWPADIDTIPCKAWTKKVGGTWVLSGRLKVGASEIDNVGVKGDPAARKLDAKCGK